MCNSRNRKWLFCWECLYYSTRPQIKRTYGKHDYRMCSCWSEKLIRANMTQVFFFFLNKDFPSKQTGSSWIRLCVVLFVFYRVCPTLLNFSSHKNSIILKDFSMVALIVLIRGKSLFEVVSVVPFLSPVVRPRTVSLCSWITLLNQLCDQEFSQWVKPQCIVHPSSFPPQLHPCPLFTTTSSQVFCPLCFSPQWATWLGEVASSRLTFTVNLIVSLVNSLSFPRLLRGRGLWGTCDVCSLTHQGSFAKINAKGSKSHSCNHQFHSLVLIFQHCWWI